MESIARGTCSGIEDVLQQVVRDQAAWTDLWTRHSSNVQPPPAEPAVDFDAQTVIAIFTGTKNSGGYSVEIKSVEGGKVTFTTTSPPPGGITTQALTQPHHIVKVPKIDGDLAFEEVEAPKPAITAYVFNVCCNVLGDDTDTDKSKFALPGVIFTNSMFKGKIWTVKVDPSNTPEEAAEMLRKVNGVTSVERDMDDTSGGGAAAGGGGMGMMGGGGGMGIGMMGIS